MHIKQACVTDSLLFSDVKNITTLVSELNFVLNLTEIVFSKF